MNKAVTMQSILPDVCSYTMNYYISLSLTSRKSSVHLHVLYSPLSLTAPRSGQLLICGL
jgi:hypothetical protein